MLHLNMAPGSVIPAHLHEDVAEVLYVIEGDFIGCPIFPASLQKDGVSTLISSMIFALGADDNKKLAPAC
jgi:Cupin